ncbi:angiotensin-converting enzyme-like [Eupeodes corollae]|uniref:angiotensin-converting enzyme-like n=1 Tax=Eupeodes corollae TaxID=290404 RepID=UPI00248F7D9A|nr:angiotensin-converting enzyme-like [Eupeodes corollae]
MRPSAQHIEITMLDSLQFLFKVVFIGSVGLIALSNATELKSNESEAKEFAKESSDLLKEFYEDPTDDYILGEASLLVDIANGAKKFDFKNFEDKQLKYEFEEIIKFADDKIMGVDYYAEMVERIIDLRNSNTGGSYFFTDDLDVPKAVVELVIGESINLKEIEFYWKEVRFTSGKWAAENLNFVLDGLKNAANTSDVSPLDFWMRHYNLTQFENLMKEIEPLYRELHAFIRNGIRKKYGDSITEPDGLIPAHLFEQVMIQAWSDGNTILEEMFPYNDLPQAKYFPYEKFKTMKWADSFYQKLGFTPFPNEVWEADIKKKKEYLLYQFTCRNDIYYKTAKVYLKFCEEMSFSQLIDSYSDMGKLYYAKEMTGLPTYFFSAYNLENAIGKAASLSAFTIHNLKAIGIIQDEDALSSSVEINRLLRKSIESLLRIPIEFVHIKMMEHLLTSENENVDHKELNKKYWESMEKYVGVKRPTPIEESDEYLDLPPEFYYDIHQNLESRKFDSEILSYQIHKKLCELSGQFPKQPLHRCDISGSKAAGDALKSMMRLGNSKPLKEVMATMFPENPTTRAEGILEYFGPVKKLLLEKNKEANVKPGWKDSKEDLPKP